MKFAVGLLIVLAFVCTVGSVIPQGSPLSYYQEAYSTQVAGAIMLFGLNDVFHCWWFVVLTLILCANLLGCNLIHFPKLMRRSKEGFTMEKALKGWDGTAVVTVGDADALVKKLGFSKVVKSDQGIYSVKNIAGIWGAWLTHLGILIVIIGFGLGQAMKTEYSVYGVPGQTKVIGDTKYELTIDDFEVKLREDDTVEQYTAKLTMKDSITGEAASGEASVNAPLSLFGMKLYQNSTGWAANMEVWKDGEKLQDSLLCAGEYALVDDLPGIAVVLSAFYPDYVEADGMPYSASSKLNNPGYLYMLYYHDQVLGMKVLSGDDKITIEGLEIFFTNPQSYTLIQIKRDPFTKVAALGGLIVMLALILAFYMRTAEIWAVQQEDGTWKVAGKSRKGGEEFQEAIRKAADGM